MSRILSCLVVLIRGTLQPVSAAPLHLRKPVALLPAVVRVCLAAWSGEADADPCSGKKGIALQPVHSVDGLRMQGWS